MKIGVSELILVFVVALFALGPDRLPEYARKLGEAVAQFKKYSDEATKDIKESVVEPLKEAQRPLKEAMEPLQDLDQAVRTNAKDIQKSFTDIGKESPEQQEKKVEEHPEQQEEKTEDSVTEENKEETL